MTMPDSSVNGLFVPVIGAEVSLVDAPGILETLAAQAAGVPAPELIARLANQFFSASPGSVDTPPSVPPTPSAPTAAAVSAPLLSPSHLSLPDNPIGLSGAFPQAVAQLPTASGGSILSTVASAPLSLATDADLRAAPTTMGGVMSMARHLPASADSFSAVLPDLPGDSLYFIAEALAACTAGVTPFQFETLTLPPEAKAYNSARIPDLRFTSGPFDPYAIRQDFPILHQQVHGKRLVWLDNAATTQKPRSVIDRLSFYYEHENSNIHRAAHTLAARATDAYEQAREKVRRFLNAGSPQEIIFVRGTTEGINLVAQSWGQQHIGQDDEIVITWLEHHANIVPWQQLAAEKGARLRVVPVDDRGQVILDEYEKLLGARTKLVAISQVSNALGTITPIQQMVAAAHRYGACVLVDGAQAVSHMPVDVQLLNSDFYVFSGHKIFGPTGIGVVYGKKALLDTTPPWQGGGNMIVDVTFERTVYKQAPDRFEAGTGNIADAIGLGAALDYVSSIGMEQIGWYEHQLLQYATDGLRTVPGLHMIGSAHEKAGVISFILDGWRPEDVGRALDQEGIAVRAGHHCAQPILRRFGVESTVRASFALYNTCDDVDALVAALFRLRSTYRR